MQKRIPFRIAILLCDASLVFGGAAAAQQPAQRPATAAARSAVYDVSRETALEGTVVSYSAQGTAAPFGPRLVLQTASGTVDVHLGSAAYLEQSKFSLAAGDAVRIVGVNSTLRAGNAIFLARVVEKNGQSLTLRTKNGMPLGLVGSRVPGAQKAQQGGAR